MGGLKSHWQWCWSEGISLWCVCVRESVEPHADLFLTKQEVGVSSSNLAKAVRQAGERDGDTHDAYTQLVWLATEKVTSCSLYLNFFF